MHPTRVWNAFPYACDYWQNMCDGFDARGRLHWLLHLLITCHVELHCFAWPLASYVSIRLCSVSFVPGGCYVYRLTLQMFMRADVLSWIKPGERFHSSLGSVVWQDAIRSSCGNKPNARFSIILWSKCLHACGVVLPEIRSATSISKWSVVAYKYKRKCPPELRHL